MKEAPSLLPVPDALAVILDDAAPLPGEDVPLLSAVGRILTESVAASHTHPPAASSAMDGYAVCGADVSPENFTGPVALSVIGESAAGGGFENPVASGQAARIFTGAPMPPGTDTVVIQENTRAQDGQVMVMSAAAVGMYVRKKGLDFTAGEELLKPGRRLTPADVALAAAANRTRLTVHRRARVAVLASGSELVPPGALKPESGQIVASSVPGMCALINCHGGEAIEAGIAVDTMPETSTAVEAALAGGPDVLVTMGGASSGDYDLIPAALREAGAEIRFQGIAMRPGKPLAWGRRGETAILTLPGNPVSAQVCACVFLIPLLDRLHGGPGRGLPGQTARLDAPLAANDARQDYVRVSLKEDSGILMAHPFSRQDSSMLSVLSRADGLAVRAPHAPAAQTGDSIQVLRLFSEILSLDPSVHQWGK